jgi:hypothetical protein
LLLQQPAEQEVGEHWYWQPLSDLVQMSLVAHGAHVLPPPAQEVLSWFA